MKALAPNGDPMPSKVRHDDGTPRRGRPPLAPGEPLTRVTVTVTDRLWEAFLRRCLDVGITSASRGVREALAAWTDRPLP